MATGPRVAVFPPLLPLSGFVAGVVLDRLWPLPVGVPLAVRILGALVLVVGAAGFAWMVVTMKRARTPIHTSRDAVELVERGPFRLTRNPMYLFGALGYAGLALVIGEPWALLLLPAVQLATHVGVVRREEAYLEARFGDRYRQYRQRVPRWV